MSICIPWMLLAQKNSSLSKDWTKQEGSKQMLTQMLSIKFVISKWLIWLNVQKGHCPTVQCFIMCEGQRRMSMWQLRRCKEGSLLLHTQDSLSASLLETEETQLCSIWQWHSLRMKKFPLFSYKLVNFLSNLQCVRRGNPINYIWVLRSPTSLLSLPPYQRHPPTEHRSRQTFTGKIHFLRATGHWKCLHSITQTHFSMFLTPSSTMLTFQVSPQREVLHVLRSWQAGVGNTVLTVSSEISLPSKVTEYGPPHSLVQMPGPMVVLGIESWSQKYINHTW